MAKKLRGLLSIDDDGLPAQEVGRGNTQLSFCFVDPFSVELDLGVIRTLSTGRKIDFLVLLALGMDANRNVSTYAAEQHDRLDRFLGDPDWRSEWARAAERGERFIYFLATRYIAAMRDLGYPGTSPDQMYPVRSDTKNLGLYYLAFFSQHPRGHHFWREVLHYHEDQFALGL